MLIRLIGAALLVAAGFLAGSLTAGSRPEASGSPPPDVRQAEASIAEPLPVASPGVTAPAPQTAAALPDFSAIASRTVGAVTNISSLQVQRRRSPFFDDPFFRRFFGDEFGLEQRRGTSAGSGVIVSSDGLILTNNHVVGNGVQRVTVVLADNRERQAQIVGIDTWTDLALLRIDATDLPTIPWGDSSALKVAEWVLAIGNPYQLSHTVTLGIVSAVGRANVNIATYEDFIQTDAAINPGNSGGALINRRGELIGINTAIYSESGGYQGIGFAVPSNLARRVAEDLEKFGEVRRGSIGQIRTVDITPQLARDIGLQATRGVLVWRMSRASAAYDAGIRPGDVIVALDGTALENAAHFIRLLADAQIGSVVTLEIVRDGRTLAVKVPVSDSTRRR